MQAKDFFISYNHRDEEWATWIAYSLEQAGYTSIIQAWELQARQQLRRRDG